MNNGIQKVYNSSINIMQMQLKGYKNYLMISIIINVILFIMLIVSFSMKSGDSKNSSDIKLTHNGEKIPVESGERVVIRNKERTVTQDDEDEEQKRNDCDYLSTLDLNKHKYNNDESKLACKSLINDIRKDQVNYKNAWRIRRVLEKECSNNGKNFIDENSNILMSTMLSDGSIYNKFC